MLEEWGAGGRNGHQIINAEVKDYMEKILNVENEWDDAVEADIVELPPNWVSKPEVINESMNLMSAEKSEFSRVKLIPYIAIVSPRAEDLGRQA